MYDCVSRNPNFLLLMCQYNPAAKFLQTFMGIPRAPTQTPAKNAHSGDKVIDETVTSEGIIQPVVLRTFH